MHISGKIFMFFVIVGAAVAAIFSAKMVHVRNSWMKKADQAQQALSDNEVKLAELTKQRNQLRAEIAREERGWNRTWDNASISQGAGAGVLASRDLGTVNGLKPDIIYIFQSDPDGGSKFVGQFRGAPQETQTPFSPTFKPRQSKLPNWRGGGDGWRIRQAIPTASISRFTDLMGDLEKMDQDLVYRQANIQTQQKLADDAQLKLDKRLNELNGEPDNNNDAENLPSWMVQGLVAAIQDEEEQRDAILEDVDDLRRVVKKTYDEIQRVIADNVARADRLSKTNPNEVGLLQNDTK